VSANHAISATFAINTYNIVASSCANGSISPAGTTTVNYNTSQSYTIAPATGYHIADVQADGTSIGAVSAHTFTSVSTNHTISATFAINTYSIVATAGANGSISPSGTTTVSYGANQTYAITPASGYSIGAVTVDGTSFGTPGAYTFGSVAAGHTISVAFSPICTGMSISGSSTNVSCNGGSNGNITTTVTGGTSGYTYIWNSGATTPGLTNVPAGTYSVTVTDAHGCTVVYSTSVVMTPRTVSIRLVDSKGNGISGGTVQYYNGTWLSLGTTDVNGYACMAFPTPTFSTTFTTYFQVLFAGGVKQWSGITVSSNPLLVATTTNVS